MSEKLLEQIFGNRGIMSTCVSNSECAARSAFAMSPRTSTDPAATLAARTRRKISRRLLPFAFVLYIIAYLDRANVGFAKLAMTADLSFSEAVFGFGSGIFFLGYFLLEIPGALIVERWSARKWIARILITWGFCTVAVGFVRTPGQF